jgi:hypothetical protein
VDREHRKVAEACEPPVSQPTLTFAISGDAVTLTHAGVNASGQQESGTVVLTADGRGHPLPQAPGIVVTTRWHGANRLETSASKEGTVIGAGSYEVSSDGATLTAIVGGVDAAGAQFEQVIVFDRT